MLWVLYWRFLEVGGEIVEISDLAVRLIILLVPGLIAIFIIEALISKKNISNRAYCTYVILLGFVSYLVLVLTKKIFKLEDVVFFEALVDSKINIDMYEILYASLISLALGIIIAIIINKNVFYRLFRKMKITNETGKLSVWASLADNNGKALRRYVYFIDKQYNLVYGGILREYNTEDSEYIEAVLENVIVTKNDSREKILREMHQVYLKYKANDIIIELGEKIDGK